MRDDVLKGLVALVTGSTSGIGRAIAHRLAREGATVCLHGLGDEAQIESAIKFVEGASGVRPRYFPADLANPASATALVDEVAHEVGGVDILVNSAGIQHLASVTEFPLEQWNAVLAINLTATFLAIQRALPAMVRRNWGRIINIASISGYIGVSQKAAYAASKHGLLGLTKVVSSETARTGVTCNAICPGWVLTPLMERQIEARASKDGISFEEAKTTLLATGTPSNEFVKPDQIAGLVAFLCSEDADEVRGVGWTMDGGRLASR